MCINVEGKISSSNLETDIWCVILILGTPIWLGEGFMICRRNERQGGNTEYLKLEEEEKHIAKCLKG
jgi:hypothetical protein